MANGRDNHIGDDASDIQGFFQHLLVFVVVNVTLLVINLLVSADSLWFYWITIFWSIGLAMQAVDAFGFDRKLTERVMSRRRGVPRGTSAQASRAPANSHAPAQDGSELEEITGRASELIDLMRGSARRIPNADARREALDACAACDQVLSALIDHPDELPIARDFLHRFLEPASSVIREYARLSSRDVPSAREMLAQVESHDLPLITRKANDLYDRLHRGAIIDLEVAREMLTLDMASPSLRYTRSDA